MSVNKIDTSKIIEFRTSKVVWIGAISLALFFFIFSVVLFYHELPSFKIGDFSKAYLVFVFMFISLSFLSYCIYVAYINPVILSLNERGLYYKSPSVGELLWKEIESIKVVEVNSSDHYGNLFEIKLYNGRKFYVAAELAFVINENDLNQLVMSYFNKFK